MDMSYPIAAAGFHTLPRRSVGIAILEQSRDTLSCWIAVASSAENAAIFASNLPGQGAAALIPVFPSVRVVGLLLAGSGLAQPC